MPRTKCQTCYYCDRPAKYLCDFVLDLAAVYRQAPDWDNMTPEQFADKIMHPDDVSMTTCDRPLCELHRVNKGHTFYCGRKPAAGIESRDFCPGHAQGPDFKPRYTPVGGGSAA